MRRLIGILAAMLVAGAGAAAALEESSFQGSRRGAFLGQAVGARPVGMGEAFTAVADDATAGFWNPGGLGQLEALNATAMYNAAGQGIGLSYLAAAMPAGPGVVAGSITMLSFGDYIRRDGNGARLGTASVTDLAGAASYAVKHPAGLGIPGSSGITLEAVNETVGGALIGVSLGSVIPAGRGLMVGWAAQHLSPKSKGFGLPAVLKLGGAYDIPGVMRIAADIATGLAGQGSWFATGAEFAPHSLFAARLGYKWRSSDLGFSGFSGFTAGAGFRFMSLGLDYAYQPYGDLATSHRVSLIYGLPPSAISLDRKLLLEAGKLYKEGSYSLAEARVLGSLDLEPDSWKAWQLLGNCRYARKDRAGALDAWKRSLLLNPGNTTLKNWVARVEKKSK